MVSVTIPSPPEKAHDLAVAYAHRQGKDLSKEEFLFVYKEAYKFFWVNLLEKES